MAPPDKPLDERITERRNPRTAAIDLASAREIVDLMIVEDATVAGAVATQREAIAQAIDLAVRAFRNGGRLFYVGAGTSGRLGVLDASECPPTFGVDPEMVQGIIAGGTAALTKAREGVEDRADEARADVAARDVRPNDFVLGVAASGTTTYVRAAIGEAKLRGAKVGILACSPPSEDLRGLVDVAIVPITGPEVITGSTRLKAGTATKMVLNMVSTGAMVRIGKTFGNLMVDLRVTNKKLEDRGERILMEVCGIDRAQARAALEQAGGHVKVAIVMLKLGFTREIAEAALETHGGAIRRVTRDEPPPV